MQTSHFGPEIQLRRLDEGEYLCWEKGSYFVPLRVRAGFPAARGQQDFLNVSLERFFGGLGCHRDDPFYIFPSISNTRYFNHFAIPSRSGNNCLLKTPY